MGALPLHVESGFTRGVDETNPPGLDFKVIRTAPSPSLPGEAGQLRAHQVRERNVRVCMCVSVCNGIGAISGKAFKAV